MGAFNKFESLIISVIGQLKGSMDDYCDLETTDGGNTIVAKDGSCVSIVKFHGSKSVMGKDDFEDMVDLLTKSLTPFFSTKGHQLQVLFRKDLDAKDVLMDNAAIQRSTAERLQLAVHDIIDEGVAVYQKYVYEEDCYLAFWSRPALLDPAEKAIDNKQKNQLRARINWPATPNAQNLLRPVQYLRDRHMAFVNKIVDDLTSQQLGCSAELLNVDSALCSVKRVILRDLTATTWKPSIPDNTLRIPFRWKKNAVDYDKSEFLYPPISHQVMSTAGVIGEKKNASLPDESLVRVGSRIYAPFMFYVPPREPQYFNTLFNSLNRASTEEKGQTRGLPYSISFMIESDGMSVMTFKSLFASILSFTSEQNRNINSAVRALREFKRDGGCIVKLRIAAMTWADSSNHQELNIRKSKLWRIIEGWGNPMLRDNGGDPLLMFQSNSLSLSPKHIGNPCPAPLDDALALLPLTRPASPFHMGTTIYRSLDGKILRYQRFSSEQTTWITLIAGKPGSGKSVLMNSNNIDACLLPGLTKLPWTCIIDVGVSSSGFIDIIRDGLPEHLKHQAVYRRLQNSENDCINPLDTPLGNRAPLPKGRDFIKNFVTMLITPPERQGRAYEGMTDFVGRMIDLAYLSKADGREKSEPETYKAGHDSVVDDALRELNFTATTATTYWSIVDFLFSQGRIHAAEVAQRYAVPTLNDLVAVANSEDVSSEYSGVTIEGNRDVIKTFSAGIREAVGNFPIFNSYTRFDLGSARIVSLDLQDVAQVGSDSANKQTALMFMIARESFMKKVAYAKEELGFFNQDYRKHWERVITEIVDEEKVFCMDEFHKTGGLPGLKLQIITDGRESRKWKMEIILASQFMSDFEGLTGIATSIFILDSGTPELRNWMRENIGLSDVEESALINFVHGAKQEGGTFLGRFRTKSGDFTQLFTLSSGPRRLWGLSTTSEDRKLRTLLYDKMPKPEARALLARKFPGGSCKSSVERLKEQMFNNAAFIDEEMMSSVVEQIAKELIGEYQSR